MADTAKTEAMVLGLETPKLTMRAQLEPLMPAIIRQLDAGVPRSDIHKIVVSQGFDVKERVFYTYISRYRKKTSPSETPVARKKTVPPTKPQNGNSEQPVVVDESQAESSTVQVIEPALDLLSNENSREEFTNQFMQRPSIRKGTKS